MLEWARLISAHWPTLGFVIALLIGVYLVARYLSQAEVRDMRRRIEYLDEQVRALRYRDEVYFAFIVDNEMYLRRMELRAITHGCRLEARETFLEFRDRHMREHGLEDEQEKIWR